jgi:outer membrane cobalamin receptor
MIMSLRLSLFSLFFVCISVFAIDNLDSSHYEMVVVGKRLRDVVESPRLESPGLTASISTVNDSDIQKQGAKTLVQALNYAPGSFTETRGKKVKQFVSFRGQKYPYPTYAVEGAWQNEFQELPYFFSAGDIEKIEITRSSAALLSSLTSLSGVVNVILKKFDKPTTQYDMEYGSFESYYAHLLHGSKAETKIGPLSYAVGLTSNITQGPEGLNAAEGITNIYGYAGLAPTKKLSIDMRIFHLQGKRDTRIFEYPITTDWSKVKTTNPDANLDPFRATFFNLKTFYVFSEKASLELIGYYTDRKSEFNNMKYYTKKDSLRYWNSTSRKFVSIDSLTAVQPISIDQDWEWGINATQAVSLLKNNILRVGALYNHWTAPNGKRYYTGVRSETETWSAVVVDEHRIGKLSLDAGLRLARTFNHEYSLKKDAYDNNIEPTELKKITTIKDKWDPVILNGNLGAAYNIIDNIGLYANFAYGQLAPRVGMVDTSYNTPETETRLKIDLGTSIKHMDWGKLTITGFYTKRNNALLMSSKFDTLPDGMIYSLYRNRDIAVRGIEVDAHTKQIYNLLTFFANGMIKSGDYDSLENTPDRIAAAGVSLSRYGLELNVMTKYVGYFENKRFSPDGNIHPLGDFISLDANINYDMGKGNKIYLRAENIGDKRYSTAIGYPDFGRRLSIGISGRI